MGLRKAPCRGPPFVAGPTSDSDLKTTRRTINVILNCNPMTLNASLRKFTLTAHVTFSVGWLGAVTAFLALAIAGLSRQSDQVARSFYVAMELIAWFVILPLNIATLVTGLVESLGTKWGIFRHYWILAKFFLTIAATIILLIHLQPISEMADLASRTTFSNSGFSGLRIQLVADATAAGLVLLVATTLSVYKPWGRTFYGLFKDGIQSTTLSTEESRASNSPKIYIIVALSVLALAFLILHIAGGGLHGH